MDVGEFFGGEEVVVNDFEGEGGVVVVAEAAEEDAAGIIGNAPWDTDRCGAD